MSISDTLAPFQGAELVPLPELGARVGMNKAAQAYAVRAKAITPAKRRGRNGRYLVTWEDAVVIALAGAMAATAGLALVTILKALSETGMSVSDAGITIPLK